MNECRRRLLDTSIILQSSYLCVLGSRNLRPLANTDKLQEVLYLLSNQAENLKYDMPILRTDPERPCIVSGFQVKQIEVLLSAGNRERCAK